MEAKNGKMSVLYSVFVITKYTWRNMKYPSYFMLRKKREECYNCFWSKYSVLKIKFFTFKIRIFFNDFQYLIACTASCLFVNIGFSHPSQK